MKTSVAHLPLRAAGLAVVVAVAASGCAASSGGGSSTPSMSPLAAVKLAAKTTGQVNSFTATYSDADYHEYWAAFA